MAYLDQGMPVERKKAALGVIAIHAVMGTVLVTGLSTVVTLDPEPPRIEGRNIEVKLDPLPPPPKPDDVTTDIITPTAPKPYAPPTPFDITTNDAGLTTGDIMVDTDDVVRNVLPEGTKPLDLPTFTPPETLYDPVATKPRNAPSGWVSDTDYKPSWINRELTGMARFTVTVGTDGRVQSCRITASTGHDVLDRATCDLVTKRARFNPALDGSRNKVAGSYSNAILWELPD